MPQVSGKIALNVAYCSGNIFRKSHKRTPLNLSRLQMYGEETNLGVFLHPLEYQTVKNLVANSAIGTG